MGVTNLLNFNQKKIGYICNILNELEFILFQGFIKLNVRSHSDRIQIVISQTSSWFLDWDFDFWKKQLLITISIEIEEFMKVK